MLGKIGYLIAAFWEKHKSGIRRRELIGYICGKPYDPKHCGFR
jgi:hypothetical protein